MHVFGFDIILLQPVAAQRLYRWKRSNLDQLLPTRPHKWAWLALPVWALFWLLFSFAVAPPALAQDSRAAARVDGRTIFRDGPTEEDDAETRAGECAKC